MSFRMSTLATLSNLSLPSPVLLCLIGHDGILFLCIWMEFEAHWSLWPFPIWRTWSSVMFRYISLCFLIKAPHEQKSCINYCMITNTIYINSCSALWHCICQYPRSQCNCRRLDNKVWITYACGGDIGKVKGSPTCFGSIPCWHRGKMVTIFQTTFLNEFLRWKLLNLASNVTEIYCQWSS